MDVSKLDRIGRYSVRDRLGAGAFALVWLGHDEVLDAPVAIKVLAENWAHQLDLRARFVEEARVLRRADSDRVVRVFDIGDLPDGRPYFVMTYADRGTLEERLTDGASLPVREALELAEQVARGVAVVHGLGVIHRDLKPSNVLFRSTVDDRERLLIADLGLSKALAHASGFTVAAGSPGYMAPEQQVMGGGIDVRVDVYGIGAMAYRMLTGLVPQLGPDGLTPPSALRSGLPAGTDTVLARALDLERERRWPSARALADALAELASRVPPEPVRDQDDDEPTVINARAVEIEEPEPEPQPRPEPTPPPPPAAPASAPASAAVKSVVPAPPKPVVVAPSARRRRWPWVLLSFILVLAAAAAGTATVLFVQYQRNGNITVSDSTGRISLTLPVRWAKQIKKNGWSPKDVLLASEQNAPGLAVSAALDRWSRQDGTPGVFVGLSKDATLEQKVGTIRHGSCASPRKTTYDRGGLKGTVYHFSCVGGVTYTEVSLVQDRTNTRVYLQLTQPADGERTDDILGSLRVQ
jgi:eukaryotic-like serine/threonine-protein kinase